MANDPKPDPVAEGKEVTPLEKELKKRANDKKNGGGGKKR
jgi:hypothetical protein